MSETLRVRYRRHRKTVNENLGLLIALAASGAALWTGYEAHRARLDAVAAADKSLKAQQQSVDAQIAATRLDERPYVRVAAVGIKPAEKGDSDSDYRGVFQLLASGRTPATLLEWNVYCGIVDSNQITGVAQTEREALSRGRKSSEYETLVLRGSAFTRATNGEAVLNAGESLQVDCPFSSKDLASGRDDVDIDPEQEVTNDKSTMMTFIVDVSYSDLFGAQHQTQQCFYVPNGDYPLNRNLLSCRKYKPIIQ